MRQIKWPKYAEWRQNYLYYMKKKKKQAKEIQRIKVQKEEGDFVNDLLDSEEYKYTRYKLLFYRYRSPQESTNQKMFYFSSKGKEILKESKKSHFDGTFKAVPKPYKQLFSIHAFYQNKLSMRIYFFV